MTRRKMSGLTSWFKRQVSNAKKAFTKNGKPIFYWFDLYRFESYIIDNSVTSQSGEPVPPMDCVMAPLGSKVKVFKSKARGTRHACINGRAVEWDAQYGLFCGEDFDEDNYVYLGTSVVAKPFMAIKSKKDENQIWVPFINGNKK
jgi:hypothetical protein